MNAVFFRDFCSLAHLSVNPLMLLRAGAFNWADEVTWTLEISNACSGTIGPIVGTTTKCSVSYAILGPKRGNRREKVSGSPAASLQKSQCTCGSLQNRSAVDLACSSRTFMYLVNDSL